MAADSFHPVPNGFIIAEQHYRCAHCGEVKPLQVHHIIFRSHGGGDQRENLEALCAECHHKKHPTEAHIPASDVAWASQEVA